MKELSVFYDTYHLTPELTLEPYLINKSPKGIFLKMSTYNGLEHDLMAAPNIDSFLEDYSKKIPGLIGVFPSVVSVLNLVLKKNLDFFALGSTNNELLINTKKIVYNNFEGLYALIIGAGHKDFVEAELVPLFKKKFDKITYNS